GAPIEVLVLQVEFFFFKQKTAYEIPAGRMLDSFGLPGRAGGVQDEQRVRGLHRLGRTYGIRLRHKLVPPVVPSFPHRHLDARTPDDDDVLAEREVCDRLVDDLLQRQDRPATVSSV